MSEIAAYTGQDLLSVVTDLATSSAHREFLRLTREEDVIWLYRALLKRAPENDDVVARRVGRPLLEVVLELAGSDELHARAPRTTAADVETLYQRLLQRAPESETVVASRVGLPLLNVAIDVFQSPEARAIQGMDVRELQEWCTLFLGAPVDEVWAAELVDILRGFRLGKVALLEHLLRMHLRRRGISAQRPDGDKAPSVSLVEQPAYAPTRHFGTKITLVIPTIDSEAWITAVVEFYNEIGIRPFYVVDSRTRDRTCELLSAAKQNWMKVAATAPRVEAMLAAIVSQVNTPWVLRLDDDELPAPALLRWCDEAVDQDGAAVWGFPRLCVRWRPGRPTLDYSTFLTVGTAVDMDRQWRLFKPACVTMRGDVHTPGFESVNNARAPAEALILHFDWVLRSCSRRREKAAAYVAQAGATAPRGYVVYETVPDEWHQFETLDHPRSVAFARRIHLASS
jgi:hypothetical protein